MKSNRWDVVNKGYFVYLVVYLNSEVLEGVGKQAKMMHEKSPQLRAFFNFMTFTFATSGKVRLGELNDVRTKSGKVRKLVRKLFTHIRTLGLDAIDQPAFKYVAPLLEFSRWRTARKK